MKWDGKKIHIMYCDTAPHILPLHPTSSLCTPRHSSALHVTPLHSTSLLCTPRHPSALYVTLCTPRYPFALHVTSLHSTSPLCTPRHPFAPHVTHLHSTAPHCTPRITTNCQISTAVLHVGFSVPTPWAVALRCQLPLLHIRLVAHLTLFLPNSNERVDTPRRQTHTYTTVAARCSVVPTRGVWCHARVMALNCYCMWLQ